MAFYSRALNAWEEAWRLGQNAGTLEGKLMADRALCELLGLYSRIGRMVELEELLNSVKGRVLFGGAAERVHLAREALWTMKNRPEISFRCGPLALQSVRRSQDPKALLADAIDQSASTTNGLSLDQVAELSKKAGLDYQMAFREKGAPSIIPSVVHWKVGHYAAITRRHSEQFFLEDPTFAHNTWATQGALEDEASGYFLVPAGNLPAGWRVVQAWEAGTVWGKGLVNGINPDNITPDDLMAGSCPVDLASEMGMPVPWIHLSVVSLQVRDTPLRYQPPVGPEVRFTIRHNQRAAAFFSGTEPLGPRWTHDWGGSIQDNPATPFADVRYTVPGGGSRTFTGYDAATQTFAPQQREQTLLRRLGTDPATSTYEMIFPDGSRRIFGLRVGLRAVMLTQVVDSAGNALTVDWENLGAFSRIKGITDTLGRTTTISYDHPESFHLITRVTDPFGRFAAFEYAREDVDHDGNPNTPPLRIYAISRVQDVQGVASEFRYNATLDLIQDLTTPYGRTTFSVGPLESDPVTNRWVEIRYPDGSRERAEFNQSTSTGIAAADPADTVPQGMNTVNNFLGFRNTFYWDRNACAQGYGDFSKARLYHWVHTLSLSTMDAVLESTKAPLERRVWYAYEGQSIAHTIGTTDRPKHIGRVLDNGITQLQTFAYNRFGRVTNSMDPLGRELTYVYAANEIDLLEVRQTRGTNDALLFSATYNDQHRPLTLTDAAGQTTVNTYNARGQLLTSTSAKGQATSFTYDAQGYLMAVNGPLPGDSDSQGFTYDALGRVQTTTDTSGYVVTYDYDAMDRLTRMMFPDGTSHQFFWDRLDVVRVVDSAGRTTELEYSPMRQLIGQTDAVGRKTRYEWCLCGSLGSLTDPMGRTTLWRSDVQGRPISKVYGDGSAITYQYENTTSRLLRVIDERQQVTQYTYNLDDTIRSIYYVNAQVPTPPLNYTYDAEYLRVLSITDGTGTTRYSYYPFAQKPVLGAGQLASLDGPMPNDTLTFGYDELGRRISTTINGVTTFSFFDLANRLVGQTNPLGAFSYTYDGSSARLASMAYPNGMVASYGYWDNVNDRALQRITHTVSGTKVSEFVYEHTTPATRIRSLSQQFGSQPVEVSDFIYDNVDQLLTATVTSSGTPISVFGYAYDLGGNRVIDSVGGVTNQTAYNALNQISTRPMSGASRTNEWDAEGRLVSVTSGTRCTEFAHDAFNRVVSIRQLTNGVESSFRRLIWSVGKVSEERDVLGAVTKRFFDQGVEVVQGPNTGFYYYTRDHLGSVRELTDAAGNVRARYVYDPYGRRTRVAGDVEADYGYAGMFWCAEAGLALTLYRSYDPELGRWLSRDPLPNAELIEGPNLYAYVQNNPINYLDPFGLMSTMKYCGTPEGVAVCREAGITAAGSGAAIAKAGQELAPRAQPALETAAGALQRCAGFVDTLQTRVQALAIRFSEASSALAQGYKDRIEAIAYLEKPILARGVPLWTDVMVKLDAEFFEIAQMMSTRYGIKFDEAWLMLSRYVGFNPDLW